MKILSLRMTSEETSDGSAIAITIWINGLPKVALDAPDAWPPLCDFIEVGAPTEVFAAHLEGLAQQIRKGPPSVGVQTPEQYAASMGAKKEQ